ncbi:MAG TPA: NAD(P)H-dependent oxidoreductase subunit E [Candidatus Acidoferrales bacterium]|nr:NAD(P)H-dependent oxidoreductase subunit E [Candidatus Acidoferrales bacterium]
MNESQTTSRELSDGIHLSGDSFLHEIDSVVAKHKGQQGELLGILEETQLQSEQKYLSEDALNHVAMKTGVPLSRIYNVVTFYSFFNLKPQGEHTVTVCRGTACHTKGSKVLLDDLGLVLGGGKELDAGESGFTSSDNKFTVSTVACFGQCALAPVVAIDGNICSNMTTAKLKKLLSKVSKGRKNQ